MFPFCEQKRSGRSYEGQLQCEGDDRGMNEPARQVSSRSDFAQIPVRSCLGDDAIRLGTMVYDHSQEPGAHNTPAAEEGNDRLSHLKGKYGELVFSEWLSANRLAASHTPFRDNYRVKVFDDDFIINQKRVEIKTKRRGEASAFPPSIKYNVNMGLRDLSHDIYVFVEIDPTGSFEQDHAAATAPVKYAR